MYDIQCVNTGAISVGKKFGLMADMTHIANDIKSVFYEVNYGRNENSQTRSLVFIR
jgi:hypothetical protein